jgi:hypothetical protein
VVDLAAINTVMATDDAKAGLGWYLEEVLSDYSELDVEKLVAQISEAAARGGADVEYSGH